jgi:hypothetical protein
MIAEVQPIEFLIPALQFVLSVALGGVGWLLKRQVDQVDRKLEAQCRRITLIESRAGDIDKASLIADSLIRERLPATYVSKESCNLCSSQVRETTTRLFSKVERLQEGQAELAGKIDVLIQLIREKAIHGAP